MASQASRRRPLGRVVRFFAVILSIPIVLAFACALVSRFGRVSAAAIAPPSFSIYAHVPNPVSTVHRLLEHESLPLVLADPGIAAAAPGLSAAIGSLKESGAFEGSIARFLGDNDLDAAFYPDGTFVACYDAGFLSPLLRLLPTLASSGKVPGLYYVQSGRLSRFEYRPPRPKDASAPSPSVATYYAARLRNLIVASNSSEVLDALLAKQVDGMSPDGTSSDVTSPDGTSAVSDRSLLRDLRSARGDVGLLVAPELIIRAMKASASGGDGYLSRLPSALEIPGHAVVSLSFENRTLSASVSLPVDSSAEQVRALIARPSERPRVRSLLPADTQYYTIYALGPFAEMAKAASAVAGPDFDGAWDGADRAARSFLGISLNELLFSWTGSECAAFALEGRPLPVFAIEVADEEKRREVFERLVNSFAIEETDPVMIGDRRVTRLALPDFLARLLALWDVRVPSPYFVVEKGILFFSESPENLAATVTSVASRDFLEDSETWKRLDPRGGASSLSLFYSLDRSVPFFLKGDTFIARVLKLYRQGVADLSFQDGLARLSLSVADSEPVGMSPLPGFPRAVSGASDGRVRFVPFKKRGTGRALLSVKDGLAFVDLATGTETRVAFPAGTRIVGVAGLPVADEKAGAVWAVTPSGSVSLVSANGGQSAGFPVELGLAPSGDPAARADSLIVPMVDGSIRVVFPNGAVESVSLPFGEPLRSPPSPIEAAGRSLMALYPKSFFGGIWLTDGAGGPLPGWPVKVSGIAFGSPLAIERDGRVIVAFLTQSGELSAYDEEGTQLAGFPLRLPGVFFAQPAFDGKSLWALAEAGTLYRVGLDASLSSYAVPGLRASHPFLAAEDVDGDGVREIFASGDGNAIYGYRADGAAISGFPLPAYGSPYVGDCNGDGLVECIALGMDGKLYGWQFPRRKK